MSLPCFACRIQQAYESSYTECLFFPQPIYLSSFLIKNSLPNAWFSRQSMQGNRWALFFKYNFAHVLFYVLKRETAV